MIEASRPEASKDLKINDVAASTDQTPAGPSSRSRQAEDCKFPPTRNIISTLGAHASGHDRLKAMLETVEGGDRVLIVISADPDAIASAAAVKRLLWRKVGQVTIASINKVKRPDNLQLLEVLKMSLESMANINPILFDHLIMVDSQPHHSPQTESLFFEVVIDHHPPAPLCDKIQLPHYADIRPDLGATATMMIGYLQAAGIRPNPRLATALFYAIKTDTQNFVRQGQLEDMNAFRWLYPHINQALLSDIERAPIARSSFKNVLLGLERAVFKKNQVHSFLEKTDHADTLVIVADFLMQIKGVNRAIVAGVCEQKLVIIFRGGGVRIDVGQLAQEAFEQFGSAGGHKNMARAEIPLANLDPKVRQNANTLNRFILRRLSEA